MFPTFPGGFRMPGLRGIGLCCKFVFRCRSASGSPAGVPELGEWWWFENSRAYLYYFFIVNDCQSVLRPARVVRVWVPGGRSNGTGFLRTVRFPYKRMSIFLFESHMLVLFMKGFLWRVRFWLRMNAGGVLNTCKSNGIPGACSWVRVANG